MPYNPHSLTESNQIAEALMFREPGLPCLQAERVLYAAHGFALAITGLPLVLGDWVAQDEGPVHAELRHDLVHRDAIPTLPAELAPVQMQILDRVIRRWGWDEQSLRDLARGRPWSQAYWGCGPGAVIPRAAIQAHFTALTLAGRAPARARAAQAA